MGCLACIEDCFWGVIKFLENCYLIAPINIFFCGFFIVTDFSELFGDRPLGIARIIISIYGILAYFIFLLFNAMILFVAMCVKVKEGEDNFARNPIFCMVGIVLCFHHTIIAVLDGLFKDYTYLTVLYILSGCLSFHYIKTLINWGNEYKIPEKKDEDGKAEEGKEEEQGINGVKGEVKAIEAAVTQEDEVKKLKPEDNK